MTNFYGDAELAAIEALRLALDEAQDSRGPSSEIHEVIRRLDERHPGEPGAVAVATALARYSASALTIVADNWGRPIGEVLDEFELAKLHDPGEEH
jgi:hypothetical protein